MSTKESQKQPKQNSEKEKGKKAEEIKTEGPLSEKDEVKQAERNTQKQQNKPG